MKFLNSTDHLVVYLLGTIAITFVLLAISLYSEYRGNIKSIKDLHVFLISFTLVALSFLLFEVDWAFVGELKEDLITKEIIFLLITLTTIINSILIGLKLLIRTLSKTLYKKR